MANAQQWQQFMQGMQDLQNVQTQAAQAQLQAANGQIQQQQQQQNQPRPQGKKVSPFSSGDGVAWVAWRDNFEYAVTINGWNNQRARREIASSMEGTAKQFVSSVPTHDGLVPGGQDAAPYAGLLDAYEAVFLPPAATAAAQNDLHAAQQSPEESVLAWHGRIRHIYRRAYPQAQQAAIDTSAALKHNFIRGLRDDSVHSKVSLVNPADFAACLGVAVHAESVAKAERERQPRSHRLSAMGTGAETAAAAGADVSALRRSGSGYQPRCYNCNQPGHIRRECPEPQKPWQQSVGGGRGSAGGRGSRRGRGGSSSFGRGGRGGRGRGGRGNGRSRSDLLRRISQMFHEEEYEESNSGETGDQTDSNGYENTASGNY